MKNILNKISNFFTTAINRHYDMKLDLYEQQLKNQLKAYRHSCRMDLMDKQIADISTKGYTDVRIPESFLKDNEIEKNRLFNLEQLERKEKIQKGLPI